MGEFEVSKELEMGFNTTVFICNDAFSAMQNDPKGFVGKIVEGTMRCQPDKPFEFGLGNQGNGFQVVSCEHADIVTLIAAGGNHATPLGHAFMGVRGHHTAEGQVEILRQIADRLGYRLVKKPRR